MDIRKMTLEQKIGQMMIAGFPSDKFDEHAASLIRDCSIGNFIFFTYNIKSFEGGYMLTRTLQEETMKTIGIPPFISVDQEGGMVTRIFDGAALLPGNMAVSAGGGANDAYEIGKIAGEELKALGINLNLAPVLDVNNNPFNPVIGVRSYGDDPKRVGELGANYIKGLHEAGVIATGKHFPGHGDTSVDSHLDLPCVPHDIKRLESVELYPFRMAIENGVDAIMSAHVLFPAIESENLPATLSHKVLTELLRRKLGFKGLIFTDCMEMKAIAWHFGIEKAAVMAVKAGADIICVSHHLEAQKGSADAIKEAVLSGEIPENRINESVQRILKMKEKYCNAQKDSKKYSEIVCSREHMEFTQKLSEKSITLVRDKKGLLPVKTKDIICISPEPVVLTGADDSIIKKQIFCESVRESFGGQAVRIPVNPESQVIMDVVEMCREREMVIVGTYNANLNANQAKLVNAIYEVNKNVIVVSLRNPYDILMFKNIPSYICAYEYTRLSIRSIIKAMKGEIAFSGKLPVLIEGI